VRDKKKPCVHSEEDNSASLPVTLTLALTHTHTHTHTHSVRLMFGPKHYLQLFPSASISDTHDSSQPLDSISLQECNPTQCVCVCGTTLSAAGRGTDPQKHRQGFTAQRWIHQERMCSWDCVCVCVCVCVSVTLTTCEQSCVRLKLMLMFSVKTVSPSSADISPTLCKHCTRRESGLLISPKDS